MRASATFLARRQEQADSQPIEQTIQEEAAEFVRRIGTLSDDPNARREMLKQTVRQLAGRLLDEFGDHYALAEQFRILSELAWLGPDALRAVSNGAGSLSPEAAHQRSGRISTAA